MNYEFNKGTEMKLSGWRGGFIHLMVNLEHITDAFITIHFCRLDQLRADGFRHSVLSKEAIQIKFSILSYILNTHYPLFLKINDGFLKKYDNMITKRNEFAHRKFFSQSEANNLDKDKFYFEYETTERGKTHTSKIEVSREIMDSYAKILIWDLYEPLRIFYVEIYNAEVKHVAKQLKEGRRLKSLRNNRRRSKRKK